MLFPTFQLLALWLVAGITFWIVFVVFGFRFARAHAEDGAGAARRIPGASRVHVRLVVDPL